MFCYILLKNEPKLMSEVSSRVGVRRVLMTNGQSRLLEVLGVKERALEKQMSPRRKMLEMVSRPSTVARLEEAGLISTDWYDATAASPHKKPATRRGGRKRLAVEKQRFYVIGCAVDEQFRKFGPAFKVLRELKIIDGNGNLNALRSELAKRRFAPKEIDVLLHARTPMGAAKRFIAQSLTNRKHRNGLSLQTIHSCHSRYLKVLKT